MYLEQEGRPIGLRATGSVAMIMMDLWVTEMRKLMEENGVQCELLRKYLDDVLAVVRKMYVGFRWNGLEHKAGWQTEDIQIKRKM